MTKNANSDGWTEQDIELVQGPFQDQMLDQFYTTLANRGYQVKTAEEARSCLQVAVKLQEKVASGELPRPNSKPTLLEQLNEKIASTVTKDNPLEDVRQEITQKVAAACEDPFVVYAATALAGLEQGN